MIDSYSVIATGQRLQEEVRKLVEFLVAAMTYYGGGSIAVTGKEDLIQKMVTLLALRSLQKGMLDIMKRDYPDLDWPSLEAELKRS